MSKIAVVGTGYVGLTTGAYLAHLGHTVVCADVVPEKVERLSRGDVPIVEPGLEELVKEGLENGRLSFVLGAANGVKGAEFVFLCVPTPQGEDGSADLTYVQEAARQIAPILKGETVVINKSTVPVGSTRVVEAAMERDDVFVVSNPEFLREGSAVYDCLNPDRIVIGADYQPAAARVAELFSKIGAPVVITDPASAETIKYAANAFLATKISFVNAMANLCEAVGADIKEVTLGMGYDKRIGFEFLRPGPGWGGSCFVGEESLIIRRNDDISMVTFAELDTLIEADGFAGTEVLSWRPDAAQPEFALVSAFTKRPYDGDVIDIQTKMGRRLTVTADHPMVVGNSNAETVAVKQAQELDIADWLPVAQGWPVVVPSEEAQQVSLLDAVTAADIDESQVVLRFSDAQKQVVLDRKAELHHSRRRDVLRCNTMKLSEMKAMAINPVGASMSTVTNGTYVPTSIDLNEDFWEMLGLFLAEGHIGKDGTRERICWSFHPRDEKHLAEQVRSYWESLGVKATVRLLETALQVSVSSRVLAASFKHLLNTGTNCYDKAIPDQIWSASMASRRALLRGLWEGDGSWSLMNGGPSVVFEYGTVSRKLADAMVRLLADFEIVARVKVGRTAKSTVDTYWLVISGASQVVEALFLFGEEEQYEILSHIGNQSKFIAPTGYRKSDKGQAFVRVVSNERRAYEGDVYSVEVPGLHTVVTSFGLVAHNCFPKDSRALVRIGEDAGYDFSLLKGVIQVNDDQYNAVANKVRVAAGGSLEGKTVGVFGLTFKANTDDLRDSPSLYVIDRLLQMGATVKGYDITQLREHRVMHGTIDQIEICADAYAAADGADVVTVLTEWDEFRWLEWDKVKSAMTSPVIVDARNLLDGAQLRQKGFTYTGIGRA